MLRLIPAVPLREMFDRSENIHFGGVPSPYSVPLLKRILTCPRMILWFYVPLDVLRASQHYPSPQARLEAHGKRDNGGQPHGVMSRAHLDVDAVSSAKSR
jgi:hypothetical protein